MRPGANIVATKIPTLHWKRRCAFFYCFCHSVARIRWIQQQQARHYANVKLYKRLGWNWQTFRKWLSRKTATLTIIKESRRCCVCHEFKQKIAEMLKLQCRLCQFPLRLLNAEILSAMEELLETSFPGVSSPAALAPSFPVPVTPGAVGAPAFAIRVTGIFLVYFPIFLSLINSGAWSR